MNLNISDTQKGDVGQIIECIVENCIAQESPIDAHRYFGRVIMSDTAFHDICMEGGVYHMSIKRLGRAIRHLEALERLFDIPEVISMRAKFGYALANVLSREVRGSKKARREILWEVIPRLREINDMESLSYCYASVGFSLLSKVYMSEVYNGSLVHYTDALFWLKKAEDISSIELSKTITNVEAKLKEIPKKQ